MGKVSKAQANATAKWEAANYEKSLIRFPLGTHAQIKTTGESINGFVNRLVKAELNGSCTDTITIHFDPQILHSIDSAIRYGYGSSRDQYIVQAVCNQLERDRQLEIDRRKHLHDTND